MPTNHVCVPLLVPAVHIARCTAVPSAAGEGGHQDIQVCSSGSNATANAPTCCCCSTIDGVYIWQRLPSQSRSSMQLGLVPSSAILACGHHSCRLCIVSPKVQVAASPCNTNCVFFSAALSCSLLRSVASPKVAESSSTSAPSAASSSTQSAGAAAVAGVAGAAAGAAAATSGLRPAVSASKPGEDCCVQGM